MDIYQEIMTFCRKHGLIDELEKSFLISESDRFNQSNISRFGLDILDAVHCIYDTKRTNFFIDEIYKKVSKGNVVLEAGIGTGILSFYAASLGAKVYGCEINPDVFKLAQEIKNHLEKKKFIPNSSVEFFLHDAITFIPPNNMDVIVSENIYTGMFFEYQVQIMNNLIKYLNTNGTCIPKKIRSIVSFSQVSFPNNPHNKELFVTSPERNIKISHRILSSPYEYDEIDFTNKSNIFINKTIPILIESGGLLNSLMIYSEVIMPSEKVIKKDDTTFLNSEIFIAINPKIEVQKGDYIELNIQYRYGNKPQDALINIKKLN